MMFPVFDGHNDFLSVLSGTESREARWPEGTGQGHLDLPRMRAGGFAGGFFAIWADSPEAVSMPKPGEVPYDAPLPPPLAPDAARLNALTQAGHLRWMERASDGALRVCLDAAQIRQTIADGGIAAIMHMEGAEAIGPDLDALYLWHAAGLRSLGPVWSRPTIFGHGVPFRYPGTPDTGDGLTEAGRDLVRACDALRVMLDVSHLNEKGFDDLAALSTGPLVATHSNAHAITPVPRNLTDRQLDMIAERRGVVGLNFANAFLDPSGRADPQMGWDVMLRHLDHLLARLGPEGVALGSDFDGARIPARVKDVTGVQGLCDAMLRHGYGDDLVRAIACDNWLALFDRLWPTGETS